MIDAQIFLSKEDPTYAEVVDFVEQLISLDTTDLEQESRRNPKIFTNLYRLLHSQSKKLKDLLKLKDDVYLSRWQYYMGKGTAQQYKNEPLPMTIIKTDVEKYLAVDEKMLTVLSSVNEQDSIVKFIEEAIKIAGKRGYDIKNAIEWKKIIAT